jgi:hypothetical protein
MTPPPSAIPNLDALGNIVVECLTPSTAARSSTLASTCPVAEHVAAELSQGSDNASDIVTLSRPKDWCRPSPEDWAVYVPPLSHADGW